MLDVNFISGVTVIKLLSTRWLPLVWLNEILIKDFFSINLDQASVTIVSNTTTIVSLSNQILNSLPRKRCFLVIGVKWL
jgi:competence transcription factor ComK